MSEISAPEPPRPSLVDSAEVALRAWLAPGRHRTGDRLPPETSLAEMLGISRGTLRAALRRLESTGEIIRRQGSGTFVGRVLEPASFHEGLERLRPYSALAAERGLRLSSPDVDLRHAGLEPRLADLFGAAAGTPALVISRTVLSEDRPLAVMVDTISPNVVQPEEPMLRASIERGLMVLDVLLSLGVPIALARTGIRARLLRRGTVLARQLGLRGAAPVLELEETYLLASGEVTHFSRDVFAPGGLDLEVNRWLEADAPPRAVPEPPARRTGSGRPPDSIGA